MQSYANAIVSSAEDPEKLLDQTVLEMNEDLIKMRQASAQVLVFSNFFGDNSAEGYDCECW